jgi:hypothetical protein
MVDESTDPAPRPAMNYSAVSRANAGTLLALIGLLFAGGILLGVVALVLPPEFFKLMLVLAAVFVLPLAFHYLTWGWWLSRMRDPDLDESDGVEPTEEI